MSSYARKLLCKYVPILHLNIVFEVLESRLDDPLKKRRNGWLLASVCVCVKERVCCYCYTAVECFG